MTTTYNVADLPRNMQRRIRINSETGCWEWTGCLVVGYGQTTLAGRKHYTHRAAYLVLAGEIPEGLQIDHLCRNTTCCNPAHLEPVTAKVNSNRRPGVNKPECKHGHPLEGHNLIIRKQSGDREGVQRQCRACLYESIRKYQLRTRAESA